MPDSPTLAVDLDGTLIRSDMLYESFWAAISAKLFNVFSIALALLGGRAALKQKLTSLGRVDVTRLPYNEEVLAYIRQWRSRGGQAVLVTASNHAYAESIAQYLGVFDDAYGSSASHNLKGRYKAEFLVKMYGAHQFAYIGDSHADLSVWSEASQIITVDTSQRLNRQIDRLNKEVTHLQTRPVDRAAIVRSLPTKRWLGNFLIFFPLVVVQNPAFDQIFSCAAAFIAFCLLDSGLNQVIHLLDRSPPQQDEANGDNSSAPRELSTVTATWLAILLFVASLSIALLLGQREIVVLLSGVALITISTEHHYRNRTIVGFVMHWILLATRIVAGIFAAGIVTLER